MMNRVRKQIGYSPFLLLISVFIASSAFHPSYDLPKEWVMAVGQMAFLPLLVCIGFVCFPSVKAVAVGQVVLIALIVAISFHLLVLLGVAFFREYSHGSIGERAGLSISFFGTGLEEFIKLIPILILYRRLVCEADNGTVMAAGFFSGLVFGCYESILTSPSNNLTGGETPFTTHVILWRVFYLATLHAILGATSASILQFGMPGRRFSFRFLFALATSTLFHFLHNVVPGFKFCIALALVAVFSYLHTRIPDVRIPDRTKTSRG